MQAFSCRQWPTRPRARIVQFTDGLGTKWRDVTSSRKRGGVSDIVRRSARKLLRACYELAGRFRARDADEASANPPAGRISPFARDGSRPLCRAEGPSRLEISVERLGICGGIDQSS